MRPDEIHPRSARKSGGADGDSGGFGVGSGRSSRPEGDDHGRTPDRPGPEGTSVGRSGVGRCGSGSLVATLGGIASAVLVALAVLGSTATDTARVMASLDPDELRSLGLPTLVDEIADSDAAALLNTGPLVLTRDDISRILSERYGPTAFAEKAGQIHRDLVRYLRRWPADTIFRITVASEKQELAAAASEHALTTFRSLEDCGVLQDVGVVAEAVRLRLFEHETGREFVDGLPDCRPTGAVAGRIEEAIDAKIRELAAEGSPTVDAFPDPEEDDMTAFSRRIGTLRWIVVLFGGGPILPLAAMGLAAVLMAYRSDDPVGAAARLALAAGLSLVVIGAAASGDAAAMTIAELFGASRPDPEGRPGWIHVALLALEGVLLDAGRTTVVAGMALSSLAVAALLLPAAFANGRLRRIAVAVRGASGGASFPAARAPRGEDAGP